MFLKKKPALLKRILAQAKHPLKDAAAVNSTRWKLFSTLQAYSLPLEVGTGGRTKYSRRTQGYDKAHWIDAACTGQSGEHVRITGVRPLIIKCMGHGNRQACKTNAYGIPNRWRTRQKIHFGFQTGDMVRAVVLEGKHAGIHTGRISVRKSGSFSLDTSEGKRDGLHYRHFHTTRKQDGYSYR